MQSVSPNSPDDVPKYWEHLRDHHLVTLELGEDGWFVARCKEINVVTQGKSFEDATKNAVEAIELVREELGKTQEFSISIKRLLEP